MLITFLLLFSFNSYASIFEEIDWKLIDDKKGINVYRPDKYKHPSGLIPIRFRATINHDVRKVLTALVDESHKLNWVPKLKASQIIKKDSREKFTCYYLYDVPWPFKDRDFVIENSAVVDYKAKSIFVKFYSVDDKIFPKKNGIVRGATIEGYTKIWVKNNQTEIEIAILNDFGGYVPTWVMNLIQKVWPYKFMENLERYLRDNKIEIHPDFKEDLI